MDEILCLACNKILKMPQFIDTDNYDGQLVCSKCKTLLYIKLIKGKLRKYKIVERAKSKEKGIRIIVQNERTKQLIQHMGDRLIKPEERGRK